MRAVMRRLVCGCVALVFAAAGVAAGAEGPEPPCGGPPVPAYAAVDAKPNWAVWAGLTVDVACARAAQGRFDLVGALAGSFREEGGAQRILERIGAVSRMTAIQYY